MDMKAVEINEAILRDVLVDTRVQHPPPMKKGFRIKA